MSQDPNKRYKIIVFEGVDGAGKSTFLQEAATTLSTDHKVLTTRLAPIMVDVFKDLIDKPSNEKGKYQDVIPGEFRHGSYIIESIVQFRLLNDTYSQYDFVLFDRWLHTNRAYLPEINNYRDWFEEVGRYIPRPDLVFYFRIDPATAVERLGQRHDWIFEKLGEDRLLLYLSQLQEHYDSIMQHEEAVILDSGKDIHELKQQVLDTIRRKFSLVQGEEPDNRDEVLR